MVTSGEQSHASFLLRIESSRQVQPQQEGKIDVLLVGIRVASSLMSSGLPMLLRFGMPKPNMEGIEIRPLHVARLNLPCVVGPTCKVPRKSKEGCCKYALYVAPFHKPVAQGLIELCGHRTLSLLKHIRGGGKAYGTY